MLGISIYLGNQSITDQKAYIQNMNRNGFQTIFTSLHIPEDHSTLYKEQLIQLGRIASALDMELMADISPASLKTLGLSWCDTDVPDVLLAWGLTGLRIDYGVDEKGVAALSHKLKIALNASTLTKEELENLKRHGLNLANTEVWHNFYPRPETGLGQSHFLTRNKWLKEEGLSVVAFVPGDKSLRGPLFAKLPTLEKHRGLSPFAAFLEMKEMGLVDKVVIGDVRISESSVDQFISYQQDEILLRARRCEKAINQQIEKAGGLHTNRADHARDVIRSVESRGYAAVGHPSIQPQNCVARPVGTITMDNENYLRYQGEIQITLTDLDADERVNVLGRVLPQDRPLLPWIRSNRKFRIKWV
ncbi:DUF871 domain-containing protein [Kroppenstedtia eburnea]|uniref:DUF871 domain-containing protein n=1 Tax=Kroppenstedtia eburnea TaxID=714067 RepID=UPI00363B6F7F